MLVDANILVYSVNTTSPFHDQSSRWPIDALNGNRLVNSPWMSRCAFLRIATNARTACHPLTPIEA